MNEKLLPAAAVLQEKFQSELQEFRGDVSLVMAPQYLLKALQLLHDDFGFNQLVDLTAVDYWPQEEPRFHIVYQLRNLTETTRLCLRVPVNGGGPHLPTSEKIYPNANWYEREVFDMFGVTFDDHSDMRRIIMPYDWQGHPLRKDYPLGYEEVQFTTNFDDVSLRKLHPKD